MSSFKRLVLTTGAAMGVLWLLASPALAKGLPGEAWPGVRTVVISVPGSGRFVAFTGDQATTFAHATGLEDAFAPQALDLRGLSAPTGSALGPRFPVMYALSPELVAQAHLTTSSVTQDLYPFAKGGPWAFTPPGQGLHVSGWSPAGPDILSMLKGEGVTASVVAVRATTTAAPAPSASRWALWLSLAAVPLLGMTAAIAARRSH